MTAYEIVFPDYFDSVEGEIEAKGWFDQALVHANGQAYRLSFIDPARFDQVADRVLAEEPCYVEPNLVVIDTVDRAHILAAVEWLADKGFRGFVAGGGAKVYPIPTGVVVNAVLRDHSGDLAARCAEAIRDDGRDENLMTTMPASMLLKTLRTKFRVAEEFGNRADGAGELFAALEALGDEDVTGTGTSTRDAEFSLYLRPWDFAVVGAVVMTRVRSG